jgi:hypothetical protein
VTVLEWPPFPVSAATTPRGDYAFFDHRFERARRLAASWPASIGPVAVLGDITPWAAALERARERPLHLRGVTTESFRFCAAILVGDRAEAQLQAERLDQDLVVWSIHTMPGERSHG